MRFLCIFHISPSISILCQNISAEKLLQKTFCDQTLYISNVCRVIRCITKVALLNNFRPESLSFLPAHGSILCIVIPFKVTSVCHDVLTNRFICSRQDNQTATLNYTIVDFMSIQIALYHQQKRQQYANPRATPGGVNNNGNLLAQQRHVNQQQQQMYGANFSSVPNRVSMAAPQESSRSSSYSAGQD